MKDIKKKYCSKNSNSRPTEKPGAVVDFYLLVMLCREPKQVQKKKGKKARENRHMGPNLQQIVINNELGANTLFKTTIRT